MRFGGYCRRCCCCCRCPLFSLLTLQILIVWYNTEWLLIQCQQPPEVAHLSGRYVWRLGLGIMPFFVFEALKRFLQGW